MTVLETEWLILRPLTGAVSAQQARTRIHAGLFEHITTEAKW